MMGGMAQNYTRRLNESMIIGFCSGKYAEKLVLHLVGPVGWSMLLVVLSMHIHKRTHFRGPGLCFADTFSLVTGFSATLMPLRILDQYV